MSSSPPSGFQTHAPPLRTIRGDRWCVISDELALELESVHCGAVVQLAKQHGWVCPVQDMPDETVVQLVLAGETPPGWPTRLSPIHYRLHAMDRSRSVVATERWMVDPSCPDLGAIAFERLLVDRLSRLPGPHDGSIVIHAESALHQRMLAGERVSVAVGVPRPRPMDSREQVELARIRANRMTKQDETMTAFLRHGGEIVEASASAIAASRGNNYPRPAAQPSQSSQSPTEEQKAVVRVVTKAVVDRVLPPSAQVSPSPEASVEPQVGPPVEPQVDPPTERHVETPRKGKLFDGWEPDF